MVGGWFAIGNGVANGRSIFMDQLGVVDEYGSTID